jgi:hypothetical protein
LLAEEDAHFPHEVDHIIAEKHYGPTSLENLAWACFDCNRFKGPNIDPETGVLSALFNPRHQAWTEHFENQHGTIVPLTTVGRVTVNILRLNLPVRVEVREILTRAGVYPIDSNEK